MYSCEWLLALSGDDEWADRLERLSFNALPAAISEDMWTHQYDQLTNQVQCAYLSDEEIQFNSNSGESHLFGLEPNYGCCTANMGQGWPKLSGAAILQAGHTIAIGAILPVSAETVADGIRVRVSVETEYPFSDSYTVRVCPEAPVTLTLSLRLPAGCLQACINGRPAEERRTRIELTAAFTEETAIRVDFSFTPVLEEQIDGLFYVRRGPLVFALPISCRKEMHEYTKDGAERRFPYCDYELFPVSSWNYALTGDSFTLERKKISGIPFSRETPPLLLHTKLLPVDWKMEGGKAALKPTGLLPGALPEEKTLVPYGCTFLRLTAMPVNLP